jgi:hypothetical protein
VNVAVVEPMALNLPHRAGSATNRKNRRKLAG